ncbi:L domain-like protein [Linderina pennispora]|uniref:L domain-like protein n=1 Tax=Linderina pennispora TaxID=61395 RepID=A0A1Y1WE24_9FUNG|nr:L domain-like protein [Linderina pennispora]ORX71767.1 L domain-like protein [Linderina pennispora]
MPEPLEIADIHAHTDESAAESEAEESGVVEQQEDMLADYADSETAIELMHSRLDSLDNLGLARFHSVEYLGLRQNFIKAITSINDLATLKELDLYDNRLNAIEGVDQLVNLTSADFSFNKIRRIENIETLRNLTEVYFVSNKISTIENLSPLVNLTSLELGANRIRRIEGLDELVNLEQLRLRILSIQSNRITKLEGLEDLERLEELYLRLENNTKLTILDEISGIKHLPVLEDLWASGNRLESFQNIEDECAPIQSLRTVYFEFSPLQTSQPTAYRRKLMLMLPQITQIDATECRRQPLC